MRLRSPLDAALASQGHVRVLRALDGLPEGQSVSVRDLARRAGLRHPRTSQVLADLHVQGLTLAQRAGRADLYQLNRIHVLYPAIHRLFEDEEASTEQLMTVLRSGLKRARRHVREAYLFGSVARGESEADSDVDLAVVTPDPEASVLVRTLDALTSDVKRQFGNDLSVHFSREPLAKRARGRRGRDLWERIATDGIQVWPTRRAGRVP